MYSYEEYPEPPYVPEYNIGMLYYLTRIPSPAMYKFISYEEYPLILKVCVYDINQSGIRNTKRKIDEIEYRTLKEASQILTIHPMTIKGRLLSKRIEFDNYKYKT